jgi:hypothetical protein
MPNATAVLRQIRCRATSKRTGKQCRNFCGAGMITCRYHGGAGVWAKAAADAREIVAEVMKRERRPMREIIADAAVVCDIAMQDAQSELAAGNLTPEALDRATLAAGRAAMLARQALDAGIDGVPDLATEHGGRIVATLKMISDALVARLGGPYGDCEALHEWLRSAMPAAIRSEPLPPMPAVWVVAPFGLALESGRTWRQRQRRQVANALRGSKSTGNGSGVTESADAAVQPAAPSVGPAAAGSGGVRGRDYGAVPGWGAHRPPSPLALPADGPRVR